MPSLVPLPVSVTETAGSFPLAGAVVVAPDDAAWVAAHIATTLGLEVVAGPDAAASGSGSTPPQVRLVLGEAAGPQGATSPERYTLEVSPKGVVLTAATPQGLFLGAITLLQLAGVALPGAGRPAEHAPAVPATRVDDAPRYGWRGLSLDIARHFYGPPVLRRVVDVLASYKLTVLHLHLTDDQGWRLEMPSRPLLTEISGVGECGGGPGGYLTQTEFTDLVDYAARRGVRVVPEIDMPGHINAATHAYGELTPDGVPTDAYHGPEVGFSKITLDNPATEPFLRDVFADLARVTPGERVHIGGDEVFTMGAEEYVRFVEVAHEVVTAQGKKVVGWQEIAQADLPAGTLVQYWDTHKADLSHIVRAAERGAGVIMSPANRVYLDMRYTPDWVPGNDWGGSMKPVDVRDSYDWDPAGTIHDLPAEAVAGVEAAVWTEFIWTEHDLFTMLLPRLVAASEVAWTPQHLRAWESFRGRLAGHRAGWTASGLASYASPQVDWDE